MKKTEVFEELNQLEIKIKHQPKERYPYTAHILKSSSKYKQIAYGNSLQDIINSLFDDGFIKGKIEVD